VRISIIVEGTTESVFREPLLRFLQSRLAGRMPKFDPVPQDGRLPRGEKLKRLVGNLLQGRSPADAVIALTDVYTGTREFADAADAKKKMREWVGEESRFYPHAAQFDFEAWLLPYWSKIQRLARHDQGSPGNNPESINHENPPSRRIAEIYRRGKVRYYSKVRDSRLILQGENLLVAAGACTELRSFLNTILSLCGGTLIDASTSIEQLTPKQGA
jgi:hypothetical protein